MITEWQGRKSVVTRQQDEEEEEILTRYESKEDPALVVEPPPNGSAKTQSKEARLLGWEFKIVRAKRDLFRDPAVFQKLCQEEELAGWVMLEKLDDRRVRFKRPIAMREIIKPDFLTFDPYRCSYGSSFTPLTLVWVLAAVLAITVPSYLGYTYVLNHLRNGSPTSPPQPLSFPKRPPA